MKKIHSTAIIEDGVELGNNIEVGPYCYIKSGVSLGDNNVLKSHIVIGGQTKIGNSNIFYPFSNIGETNQDLKFVQGEDSFLEIGNNNIIRENVTIHNGTNLGNNNLARKNLTKIGDNNLLMVGVHIAHDCVVGNNVILANNATLAGHVFVGNNIMIGGLSAVQQFVRIGDYAIIGGMSGVEKDVLPFALIMGERAYHSGINLIGLKRNGFERADISLIKKVTESLFDENSDKNFNERAEEILKKHSDNKHISLISKFLNNSSKKAICSPKKNG